MKKTKSTKNVKIEAVAKPKHHLIIFAHPNSNSFTKAMVDQIILASEKAGAETVVRNLYTMNFNPILSQEEIQGAYQGILAEEIRYEQQLIHKADLITLVYPLWWMGFPAILKGYLDRVLTAGFAYQTDANGSVGLIHGKKMQQFVNLGSNVAEYETKGFAQALDVCLINGLFNFCGITDIDYELFGSLYGISDQERQAILTKVAEKTTKNITAL
ncbi:NAD(P)H oxidoreductase [Pasteurellaceae bacterium Pebbles2]|nr:NAD(P)H oxidoreductase [Pasteurellaceae bacterium Pebbles2]